MVLSEEQMKKERINAVIMFALLAMVVVPSLNSYMDHLNIRRGDDPRINMEALEFMDRLDRKRKKMTIPNGILKKGRFGCNAVCHADLDELGAKKKKHMKSWIKMCQSMGDQRAVRILKQYLNLNGSQSDLDSIMNAGYTRDQVALNAIELYTLLIEVVTPSINQFLQNKSLPTNNDPFKLLDNMVRTVKRNPLWLGPGNNNQSIVKTSFDARNSTCHFKRNEIKNNHKIYITSWMELCSEMGDAPAAAALRNSL